MFTKADRDAFQRLADQQFDEQLRGLLLNAHPEWRGKIWIYKDSVTVRGVGSVFPRYPEIPVQEQAKHLLFYFDDLIDQLTGPANQL